MGRSLRDLPSEVRVMIFKEMIEWKGTTPPLIIALRGDSLLHNEAMEVLYWNHFYNLPHTESLRMPVQHLSIEYTFPIQL